MSYPSKEQPSERGFKETSSFNILIAVFYQLESFHRLPLYRGHHFCASEIRKKGGKQWHCGRMLSKVDVSPSAWGKYFGVSFRWSTLRLYCIAWVWWAQKHGFWRDQEADQYPEHRWRAVFPVYCKVGRLNEARVHRAHAPIRRYPEVREFETDYLARNIDTLKHDLAGKIASLRIWGVMVWDLMFDISSFKLESNTFS